jgi:hypothetical protein
VLFAVLLKHEVDSRLLVAGGRSEEDCCCGGLRVDRDYVFGVLGFYEGDLLPDGLLGVHR